MKPGCRQFLDSSLLPACAFSFLNSNCDLAQTHHLQSAQQNGSLPHPCYHMQLQECIITEKSNSENAAEAVRVSLQQGSKVLQAILSLLGSCARLTEDACSTVKRVERLFFLNEGQGLSNFLTQDLYFISYPNYKVWRTRGVFPTRAALLAYETALSEAKALDDALEVRRVFMRLFCI